MFGIGFSELIVILIVALVVLGPEKLQDFAKSLGKFISNINNFSNNIKEDISVSLNPKIDINKDKNDFKEENILKEKKDSDTSNDK